MSHQHHHIVASRHFKKPIDALIDSTRTAKRLHSHGKQAVHIIFANLILSNQKWQAITSVTSIDDIDGDGKPAIIFGHLPAKYEEYYDDLLAEVDHLNLINNYVIWRDIKKHLLDLHFYQAVHFGEIQRIAESGGGFFKEKKDKLKIKDAFEFTFDQTDKEPPNSIEIQALTFEETSDAEALKAYKDEYDVLLRNQREGRRFKNLVVK